jgi:hypothetical protein
MSNGLSVSTALRLQLLTFVSCAIPANVLCAERTVPEIPCFDEYHQIYEQNDGGYFVRHLRDTCNEMHEPLNGDPGAGLSERKQEHIEVFFSAGNERVIHKTSEWVINPEPSNDPCHAGISLQHSTKNTVFIDGTVRESKSTDALPIVNTTRDQSRSPYFTGGPHRPRSDDDPFFEHRGIEVIAGFKCERINARPPLVSAGSRMSVCALPLASSCLANGYIAPLDSVTSEGAAPWTEIKTLSLEVGAKGKLFDALAISQP